MKKLIDSDGHQVLKSRLLPVGIPPPGLVFQPRGSGFCDVKPRGPRGPVYTGHVNTEY